MEHTVCLRNFLIKNYLIGKFLLANIKIRISFLYLFKIWWCPQFFSQLPPKHTISHPRDSIKIRTISFLWFLYFQSNQARVFTTCWWLQKCFTRYILCSRSDFNSIEIAKYKYFTIYLFFILFSSSLHLRLCTIFLPPLRWTSTPLPILTVKFF